MKTNYEATKNASNCIVKFNVYANNYEASFLENVWGDGELYQYKTVNVAINRLKEKIDPDKTKEYIQTVRGVGYKLC